MPFDPKAFLAEPDPETAAPSAAFDPKAFLADAPAPTPKESLKDAVARQGYETAQRLGLQAKAPLTIEGNDPVKLSKIAGNIQGYTSGFADEIGGIARALSPDAMKARSFSALKGNVGDSITKTRAEFAKQREYDPKAYDKGVLQGALASALMPTGMAAAAGKAAQIGRAAVQGGVAGAGFSDANSATELATGTLKGAALGAGTAGALMGAGKLLAPVAGKAKEIVSAPGQWLVKGAEGRADKRLIQALTTGAKPTQKQLIGQSADEIATALKDAGFTAKQLSKADKVLPALKKATNEAGKEIGQTIETLDNNVLGPRVSDTIAALRKLRARYEGNPAEAGKRLVIDKQIRQIEKDMGAGRTSFRKLQNFKSSLQTGAYAGSKALPEKEAAVFGKEMAGSVNDSLRARVAEVVEQGKNVAAAPSIAARPGMAKIVEAGQAAEKFAAQNAKFGALETARKAVVQRAGKSILENVAPTSPSFWAKAATNPGAALGAYALDPTDGKTVGTALLALQAARLTGRGFDKAVLAMARAGAPRAVILKAAAEIGVKKSLARKILDSETAQAAKPAVRAGLKDFATKTAATSEDSRGYGSMVPVNGT